MIMLLLGFFTRKIFVNNIGVEYLGLNGLLSNILGVMTLLEGGFATSVVYNLYKPLAEDDQPKILALIQLYRKVYRYVAIGIIAFSLIIYPFLDIFIKDVEHLSYVTIVYFIFVFNSVIQYFTAYKWSLINASQRAYKLTGINLFYQIGSSILKILILYYTKNYILYLIVDALFLVLYNILIVKKANKLFPYIVTKEKYVVESGVKNNIITNMKALFIHKLGGYFMHSTDNIVISSFVGVYIIGLYSNYTLVIGVVRTLISQILNSFTESVGNLIATETTGKIYDVFKTTFFLNFLVVSIPVIVSVNTLTPLVNWWLGEEYGMKNITVYVMLLYFYIDKMRSSSQTFKVKAGIFMQDRWTPFFQGCINLLLSLIFVQLWDITGVLFASVISVCAVGFWQWPRLCYKYIFHKPLKEYFKMYISYTLVAVFALLMSILLCEYNNFNDKLSYVVVNAIITLVVVTVVYVTIFYKNPQCRAIVFYVRGLLKR